MKKFYVGFIVLLVIAYFIDESTRENKTLNEERDAQWEKEFEILKENFFIEFEKYDLISEEILMSGYTGKGSYIFSNNKLLNMTNAKYVGEFKNGVIEGNGYCLFTKPSYSTVGENYDTFHYSGQWKEGLFDGEGTMMSDLNPFAFKFNGTYKNGYRFGYGKSTNLYGRTQIGIFEKDRVYTRKIPAKAGGKKHSKEEIEKHRQIWLNKYDEHIGRQILKEYLIENMDSNLRIQNLIDTIK